MAKWCVVATRQARERLACTQMANQGLETFLPQINKFIMKGGASRTVRKPLFPGYVFVRLEPEAGRWRSINGTLGVKRLLMQNEKPSTLPDGFIETLRDNLSVDGVVEQHRFLQVGDRATVVSGPFAHQVGELLKIDSKGRVEILLILLSSKRPVKSRIEYLMPA